MVTEILGFSAGGVLALATFYLVKVLKMYMDNV